MNNSKHEKIKQILSKIFQDSHGSYLNMQTQTNLYHRNCDIQAKKKSFRLFCCPCPLVAASDWGKKT